MESSTVAAIATPPGQGGIAVVRLSGPETYAIAGRVFHPRQAGRTLKASKGYSALFGDFIKGEAPIDEGIALCFKAPHSYTGEDVVELSCHGGEVVSRQLLAACIEAGAAPAGPGEFTRRAVLNGRMSLTQAEAVMDLISAGGQAAAAAARTACSGALHRKITGEKNRLIELAGHLAAWTDYPEEDVEELDTAVFYDVVNAVEGELEGLIRSFEKGGLVRRGVRTVIVGSPNVGKSTLFNLLSGFEHAIVTPVAGTTRDILREQVQVGGVVLQVADTAGLHATDDPVEQAGIGRAEAELEDAQLVLAVFDGSQVLDDESLEFARRCTGRPALGIVNKSDLGLALDPQDLRPYFRELIVVSAHQGETLKTLEVGIKKLLSLDHFDPDAAMLANQRQLAAAVEARAALQEAKTALGLGLDAAGVCLDDAIRALARLTGEDATEAVIAEVFSKFCVGK